MKLTLRRFDENEWQKQLESLEVKDMFGDSNFLNTIAKVYQVNVVYQGVFRNDKPILLIAYFEKKKKIIFPNHYFFQFLWQNRGDDEWTMVEAWELLLNKITNGYQKIKLRLPIHIDDVRPFTWNGFSYILKHTYIKNLDQLIYHHNINRIITKESLGFEFSNEGRISECFSNHAANLKHLLFKKSFIQNLEDWFLEVEQLGLLKIFSVKIDSEVVASIIAIVDRNLQKAYFPLISKPNADVPKEISAKLYDFSLKNLKEMGIKEVDLYGASMKSIARFKTKFNPTLVSFFEVEYGAGQQVFNLLKGEVKQKIKKLIR